MVLDEFSGICEEVVLVFVGVLICEGFVEDLVHVLGFCEEDLVTLNEVLLKRGGSYV